MINNANIRRSFLSDLLPADKPSGGAAELPQRGAGLHQGEDSRFSSSLSLNDCHDTKPSH